MHSLHSKWWGWVRAYSTFRNWDGRVHGPSLYHTAVSSVHVKNIGQVSYCRCRTSDFIVFPITVKRRVTVWSDAFHPAWNQLVSYSWRSFWWKFEKLFRDNSIYFFTAGSSAVTFPCLSPDEASTCCSLASHGPSRTHARADTHTRFCTH
jgi:hypothetical protein